MKSIVIALILMLACTVVYAQDGTKTIQWDAPTTNEDGSPLTDLDHFTLYYKLHDSTDENSTDIPKDQTETQITLPAGHYCFNMTASDTSGNESSRTNTVCTDITDNIAPSEFTIRIKGE